MDLRKIILLVGLCLFGVSGLINGQTIKRHVIGSLGMNRVDYGTGCTSITVGQPPNAGTVSNGANTLRQGFQQPAGNCPIHISYNVSENVVGACGTYYTFEYSGDVGPNTTVMWNFGGQASPNIVNDLVTPEIAFAEEGTIIFTITVSDGTCMRTKTSTVFVDQAPFNVTSDIEHAWCAGDRGTINLTVNQGQSPYTYLWNTGSSKASLTDLLPGIYRYTVSDANGCVFSQSAEVLGSTEPLFIEADIDNEICTGTADGSIDITILNGSAPFTYQWADGTFGPVKNNLTQGTYDVMIEDSKGCTIDTFFVVKAFCELDPNEFIPDIFTPNGDGFNDNWVIEDLYLFPNNNVRIYNRWGNLVWDVDGFTTWDGTNNDGEILQSSAYFYIIKLNDAGDTTFSGSVTLVR